MEYTLLVEKLEDSKTISIIEALENIAHVSEEETKAKLTEMFADTPADIINDAYTLYMCENDTEIVESISVDETCGCDSCDHGEDCECLDEEFFFESKKDGDVYDIEYDLADYDLPSDDAIDSWIKYQKELFAEDFELIEAEGNQKARVVFKRAKGEIVKKKKCPKGLKLKGRRCIKQSGTQKALNRRLGIKLRRAKKAEGAGKRKRSALKRKITRRKIRGRARTFAGL